MRLSLLLLTLFATLDAFAASQVLTVLRYGGSAPGVIVSSPSGIDCEPQCQFAFAEGTQVVLSVTAPPPGKVFAGWSAAPYAEDDCQGGHCRVVATAQKEVGALFTDLLAQPSPYFWFPQAYFNDTSIGTTSVERTYLVNAGTGSFTITGLASSDPHFTATSACSTLGSGEGCDIEVTFAPDTELVVQGTLTIATSAGSLQIPVSGKGERSLVLHFYESILRRWPDFGGRSFWNAEVTRMQGLGANVNETWFAMAQQFFFSAEYLALNRDDTAFVIDLYTTFFNRTPDSTGLDFWTSQLAAGMPREVVLAAFELSPEFKSFTQAIFGNTSARAEVDVVMDFYRGLLARLPDDGGFNGWVHNFRTAQCQGRSVVNGTAEVISSGFVNGIEYPARNRTNAQYVGDLYNAFLRRGGDLAGVQYWIDRIATQALTREQVRQQFIASGEFQARVTAIVNQGCMP